MTDVNWKALAIALTPIKPDMNASCGPCCYYYDDKYGYLSNGCHCGNFDDAMYAGQWAENANAYIKAQRLYKLYGVELN